MTMPECSTSANSTLQPNQAQARVSPILYGPRVSARLPFSFPSPKTSGNRTPLLYFSGSPKTSHFYRSLANHPLMGSVRGVRVPQGQNSGFDLPMGCWSEPPRDVLEFILDKLNEHRDILLFSTVCVAWRSFILANLQRFPRQLPLARCLPQQCQLPLLMIPCKEGTDACDFFCAFEQKFYGGAPLPDSNKWIFGSSKGWLVTADIRGSEIYLFNPISRDQIYLPSQTEIPLPKCDTHQFDFQTFNYLSKAVLSKSPSSNIEECAVMAIISSYCVLAFCRLGDGKWTSVADSPIKVSDINYYKDQFYAVDNFGVVVACDTGPNPKATAVVAAPALDIDEEIFESLIFINRYLVESQGELLQVVRMIVGHGYDTDDDEEDDEERTRENHKTPRHHRTVDFEVFKLQEKGHDEDTDKEEYESIDGKIIPVENSSYQWVKLDNLCNQIIFVGFNQSLSLPASALQNSRGNCIYFTDDYMYYYYGRLTEDNPERFADMGVFNLEDGSVHPFHPKGLVFPMPPIWVSPAPW